MASLVQFRRDTAANWTSSNPVMAEGELGLDLTNDTFKIGDGTTAWNSLAVASGADGADGADGEDGVDGDITLSAAQATALSF